MKVWLSVSTGFRFVLQQTPLAETLELPSSVISPPASAWVSVIIDADINAKELTRVQLEEKLLSAGLTNVEIERSLKAIKVILFVSRPGVVIGRGGSGIEETKKEIVKAINELRKTPGKDHKIDFQVNEVKNPESSAILTEPERKMSQ